MDAGTDIRALYRRMMKNNLVIIGYNQWEEYTEPLVRQAEAMLPGWGIMVVDNGSEPPYPQAGTWTVRSDNQSLSRAINAGIDMLGQDWEWAIVLNNDVVLTGVPDISRLNPQALYGMEFCKFYLLGWCMAISRQLWQRVGKFDERYTGMSYEDVDYSFRVLLEGMPLHAVDLPFIHLEHKSWHLLPLDQKRIENKEKFRQKFREVGDQHPGAYHSI